MLKEFKINKGNYDAMKLKFIGKLGIEVVRASEK